MPNSGAYTDADLEQPKAARGAFTDADLDSSSVQAEPASAASRFGSALGQTYGYGVPIKKQINPANILHAQAAQLDLAKEAWHKGDAEGVLAHALGYALPLIGPSLAQAGEQGRKGDIAGMLGTTAGIASQIGIGKLAPNLPEAASATGEAVKQGTGSTMVGIGKTLQNKGVASIAGGAIGGEIGHPWWGMLAGREVLPALGKYIERAGKGLKGIGIPEDAPPPDVDLSAVPYSRPVEVGGGRMVILPGEQIDPQAARSAGSAAQATTVDLQRLAASGDAAARLELVRRRIPVAGMPTDYSNVPLPRGNVQ